MRHFHSVKRGALVDECPRCAGFWLDAGELAAIRTEFATEKERKQAAQEYFAELLDPDLAGEGQDNGGPQKSAEDRARLPLHLPELLHTRRARLGGVLERSALQHFSFSSFLFLPRC